MKDDDIRLRINICKRAIVEYNDRMSWRYIDGDRIDSIKINIQKEEEILQYYKDEYPEYFL